MKKLQNILTNLQIVEDLNSKKKKEVQEKEFDEIGLDCEENHEIIDNCKVVKKEKIDASNL